MTEAKPRDMFGNVIQVGDILVKPHSAGRSASLGVAVVLAIKPREETWSKVQQFSFRIRTVTEGWGDSGWEVRNPGTFKYGSRCIVYPKDKYENLPNQLLDVLTGIQKELAGDKLIEEEPGSDEILPGRTRWTTQPPNCS